MESNLTSMLTSGTEMESPYLLAIQHVRGDTPGEKYKTLNYLARKLVDVEKSQGHIGPIVVKPSEEIPEVLVPIVSLEISKILRQPEGILAALKSDDAFLFERALKAKWFFDGTNKNISNVHYFEREIFSHTSLNNRIKIVKALAKYLAPTKSFHIAEEFYEKLAEKYGKKFAEPLLVACEEAFIKKTVWENKIILNIRTIRIIFRKFPNFVIEYLKLSYWEKIEDPVARLTSHRINIWEYVDILPYLVKNHTDALIEIIEMHNNSFGIKLHRRRTDLFLKNGIDALLRSPKVFLSYLSMPMMSLKSITEKLTKLEFNELFKRLFTKKVENFNFDEMYSYLEFYPKEERMILMLSTFKDVYGRSLLEFPYRITPKVLRLLTPEQRVEQARKKLEYTTSSINNIEESWNSYLPTEESIPVIKNKISKCSDSDERCKLLFQLIYTCHVNQDNDALLESLNYIITRHKNEPIYHLLEVLEKVFHYFDAITLSKEHWEILEKFIRLFPVNITSKIEETVFLRCIIPIIHYKLVHREEILDFIDMYIEFNICAWKPTWNILVDYPEFERKSLETFVKRINEIAAEKVELTTIMSLMTAIYNFNERNSKAKCKLENLSIRNFEWLYEKVKGKMMEVGKTKDLTGVLRMITNILRKNEIDLYEEWTPAEIIEQIDFDDIEICVRLKKDPKRILNDWEKYLEKCVHDIYSVNAQKFVSSCRWHKKIPILFAKKCFENLEKKDDRYLIVLALLYEGSAFEKIINMFIPTASTIDPSNRQLEKSYRFVFSIPSSLNVVNPPVSLDLVLQFCQGDYMQSFINCLVNMGRRITTRKVMEFSKQLMSRGVSIKKHGIRLFCMVGDLDEVREMLISLWKTENHRSIRDVVFGNIYKRFIDTPSPKTWAIMKDCINEVKIDDDAIESIFRVDRIPKEFVVDYVKIILVTHTKLMENGLEHRKALSLLKELWRHSVSISVLFPEELHQHILRTFFADLSRPEIALSQDIRNYVVNAYICYARDKLESRLAFLAGLFIEIVEKYWDVPQTPGSTFFMGNYMIYMLIEELACIQCKQTRLKTVQVLQDTFLQVLKPTQSMNSYLTLVFHNLIDVEAPAPEISSKIREILPSLISEFSIQSISMLTEAFNKHFTNMQMKLNLQEQDVMQMHRVHLDIIQHLINGGDEYSVLFAAMMLYGSKMDYSGQQYLEVIDKLKKSEYPTVVSAVYNRINASSRGCESVSFKKIKTK